MICTENTIYVQLYCMVHYFKARMNALNWAEHCEIRHIIILASLENVEYEYTNHAMLNTVNSTKDFWASNLPNVANFITRNLHFIFCCNIYKYNRGWHEQKWNFLLLSFVQKCCFGTRMTSAKLNWHNTDGIWQPITYSC